MKPCIFRPVTAAFASLVLVGGAGAAPAPVDRCQAGVTRYNANLDTMIGVLRTYTNCVGESRGRQACSAEFTRLRAAHVVLEAAVKVINTQCLPDDTPQPPPKS